MRKILECDTLLWSAKLLRRPARAVADGKDGNVGCESRMCLWEGWAVIIKRSAHRYIVSLFLLSLLACSGCGPSVESPMQRLKSPDPEKRVEAVVALGQIGDKQAVQPLIACLKDNDSGVRGAAARALGLIGDARAAGALMKTYLNDKDPDVRRAAHQALGCLVYSPTHMNRERLTSACAEIVLGCIRRKKCGEVLLEAGRWTADGTLFKKSVLRSPFHE